MNLNNKSIQLFNEILEEWKNEKAKFKSEIQKQQLEIYSLNEKLRKYETTDQLQFKKPSVTLKIQDINLQNKVSKKRLPNCFKEVLNQLPNKNILASRKVN